MAALAAEVAAAEPLFDPTQPPGMEMVQEGAVPAGPVLQSVMMGTGRKAAMISGQLVAVGKKYGEATLIRVTERTAVLRNDDGTLLTLEMHPSVTKKVVVQKRGGGTASTKNKRSGATRARDTR